MAKLHFGKLPFVPALEQGELLALPTKAYLQQAGLADVLVSEIDPSLADTAAFCEQYAIGLDVSANCVIVEAKRGNRTWYAACVILATTKADINGVIRRQLGARKISFAPMETAIQLTGMEYGGITPLGLPEDWEILVDSKVAATDKVIIGSGIRGSKILLPGQVLAQVPNVTVMDITK